MVIMKRVYYVTIAVLTLFATIFSIDVSAQQSDSITVIINSSESACKSGVSHGRGKGHGGYYKKQSTTIEKGRVFVDKKGYRSNGVIDRINPSCGKKGHWAGIGIGYNGLVSGSGSLTLPDDAKYMSLKSKSVTVMVNLFDFAIVSQGSWALISGLGFEFNNFQFENNIGLSTNLGYVLPDYSYAASGIKLEKSKLVTSYINVPLLMEFRLGRPDQGFINFGFIGGWRMHSHTKVKGDLPGDDKVKKRNSQYIKNFHWGATGSLGYGRTGLYITYYPQSIFKEGRGPHVEQVNIGVTFLL